MNALSVKDSKIEIKDDYFSLTDIANNLADRPAKEVVRDWLKNRNTISFLEAWEAVNNPNGVQMDTIKIESFKNDRALTAARYIELGGIGIRVVRGRYGGMYAHIEIALEFTTWLNPEFKVFFFREWVQMREKQIRLSSNEWTLNKIISNSLENARLAESIIERDKTETEGKE